MWTARRFVLSVALLSGALSARHALHAQPPSPAEFDVVSIKRNTADTRSGGGRTLPDGTTMLTHMPIRSLILGASPVSTREVIGLPDWAMTEFYDITTKPPAGSTSEQRKQMMQAMFADRMKLVAHVEQRERTVYSLVLARSDGRLGPELKASSLDCGPRPAGAAPPPPVQAPMTPKDALSRCGMMMRLGHIASGGMRMAGLASTLYALTGGEVVDHTGLDGFYSVNLTFALSGGPAAPAGANNDADDAPDIFTAVQEQLGLKLVPAKKMMPVFVIDHIERPSEN